MPNSNSIFTVSLGLLMITSVRSHDLHKRQAINVQNPPVWQALDVLRGSTPPNAAEVQSLMASAVPGQSYPTLSYIPQTSFSCSNVRQPGFYADPDTGCQVFRRCEQNNYMFSYMCPNTTLFNQITLVCDYWYNVQCQASPQFVDYSNPRIYNQNALLLDDINIGSASGSGNLIDGSGGRYSGGQVSNQQNQGGLTGGGGGQYGSGGSGQNSGLYSTGQSGQSGGTYQSGQSGGTYQSGQSGGTYQSANQMSAAGGLYGSGGGQQPSRGSAGYSGSTGQANNNAGYSGSFFGSYSPNQGMVSQQQQQLPFGTQLSSPYPARIQQSSSAQYQSAGQQAYPQPSPQFQQAGYAAQQLQQSPYTSSLQQPPYAVSQAGPSYRSLSNRLLRLQADASERVIDVVTTQVSAPLAESSQDPL